MATKFNVIVEYQGRQTTCKDLEKAAKEAWTDKGNKVKDLKTADLYVKPEENAVYYVFNENEEGKIEL